MRSSVLSSICRLQMNYSFNTSLVLTNKLQDFVLHAYYLETVEQLKHVHIYNVCSIPSKEN